MRRFLLVVAMLAVAACTGGAAAYFTGQADVPDNLVRAGTVAVSTEPTAAALSVGSLAPGVTEWRPLTLVNAGTLPFDAVMTAAKKAGYTEFYNALGCKVLDESGGVIYEGPLASLSTTRVVLQPGARRELRFGISLPEAAGNTLQGDYVRFTVTAGAEQSR